jgi:uncharacterized membrane protein
MGSGHSHRHSSSVVAGAPGRLLVVLLGVIGLLVVVGLVWLWPAHRAGTAGGLSGQLVGGTVRSTQLIGCEPAGVGCERSVVVQVSSGPDAPTTTTLTFAPGPTDPGLRVGDEVRLARAVQGGQVLYEFDDIARGRPLLLLGLVFLIVVLAVGRWRGLAAVAGLVLAGVLLVVFTMPALLAGSSPIWVALVTGAAITLVVLPLSHGASATTGIAMLGTLAGMTVAAVAAAISVASLRITGLSSEENTTLALRGAHTSVSGLLLAGAVIGALGVLNDVTVTQAAAVAELRAGGASRRVVLSSAMRIGRDHIASTVYSLVLAYTGSSLPLLLLFSLSRQSTTDVLTSDSLAPEIATSLIGGIALVLVVPLTTALAAAINQPATEPAGAPGPVAGHRSG